LNPCIVRSRRRVGFLKSAIIHARFGVIWGMSAKEAYHADEQADIEQMQGAVATSLHEHWVFFLVEGIILVILVWPPSLFRASLRSRSRSCLAGSFSSADSSA